MIHGHIVFNSKRSAQEELGSTGKVFCLECNKVEELKIGDFGFGDHFGGVSDYRVVTENCEGTDWAKAECEVCGTDGEAHTSRKDGKVVNEPASKLVRAPKESDLRVVCEKCWLDVKAELVSKNGMTEFSKDFSPKTGEWYDL